MPEGVVQGGWPYVIAVYTITSSVLAAYAVSLALRLKRAKKDSEHE